jgi:BMFP domain-containing protein YqiC
MTGTDLITQMVKKVIAEAEKSFDPEVEKLLNNVKTEVLKVVTMLEDKVEAFEDRLKALESKVMTPAPPSGGSQ